ncbi:necrosis inducing protein [Ilyonectria sp. MPI-CAGE-AT-0026]|nr:necrosis inducing protein [Ilyonectria sp. MPI-CAGE-AT-0026]
MQTKLFIAVALLSAVASIQAEPTRMMKRDVLTALPESADDIELKFQPKLDFDTDGCYNTAAIDPDGNTNPGHDATGTPQGDCRDPHQLENSNAYSRKRCNNGFCAIMYEYYFEKDQAALATYGAGHRHDWENIIVFVQGENVVRVATSCHSGFSDASNEFTADGTNPLVVYHKDGGQTHCFRFANDADIGGVENYSGSFYRSPLVGWDHWPNVGLRDKLLNTWSGGVGPKLDTEFGDKLKQAAGDGVTGFDPYLDA